VGLHNRYEEGICAKKKEDISIVEGRAGGGA